MNNKKIANLLKYLLRDFAPSIAFYIANLLLGHKWALVISLSLIVIEFILIKRKKQKISMLFYAFNSVIIFFCILELLHVRINFYQYEAFLSNTIIALFWASSIFKDKSVVQEIAEVQGRTGAENSLDKKFFFNFFTLFWASYFLAKGILYFWIFQNPSIKNPFIVRIITGKVTLWIMIGISTLLPEKIWKIMNQLRVLPSYRDK